MPFSPLRRRRILLAFGIGASLLIAYIGSYAWLSLRGRYEPHAWGLQGPVDANGCYFQPKGYRWTPCLFTDAEGQFNHLPYVYFPLYWLDLKWGHNRLWPAPGDPALDVDVARDRVLRQIQRSKQ